MNERNGRIAKPTFRAMVALSPLEERMHRSLCPVRRWCISVEEASTLTLLLCRLLPLDDFLERDSYPLPHAIVADHRSHDGRYAPHRILYSADDLYAENDLVGPRMNRHR
ncbi:hypothetical protein EVAR_65462_1 [Eumeta japonica]|uniref:Uncharacterized protein n=1 Tax=Eumeta variegata TaxID=151549 RepID=A0A4C1YRG7_EUMVA|nr:hypothetical protein EVAR_65462_1 [Eumeta japonica]